MSDLGTAYVQVVPSAQGIKGALSKQFGAEGASAGQSAGTAMVGKMKGLIAGAAIGTTVVAGIKKAIGEGAALEQSLGGVETLFKGSADTVIANAKKAYKTAGMSANEYMENVTSFSASLIKSLDGDTSKAAKVADTAMIDMSDNANKMGTDIGAIQNAYQGFAKQNYTMLDNLKLGYGGTKTEMERLLADAGKISGQKYDMSNLSDVYEAIHVVQNELGITGTTAKEASETISGSFASLKASFSDFMGNLALGQDIAPSMQNLINSAVTFLAGNLLPAIGRIFMSLPQAIGAGIQTASAYIPSNLMQLIQQGLNTISAALPQYLNEGVEIVTNIGTGIIENMPAVINTMSRLITMLVNFIAKNYPKIVQAGIKLISGLAVALVKNAPKIMAAILKLNLTMTRAFLKLAQSGLKAGGQIIKAIGNGIGKGISAVLAKVKSLADRILSPIKGAVSKIKGLFPLNIGRIFSGMKLPHFNVSGGTPPFGLMGKGTKPSISVDWYAKGGIVTQPTLAFAGMGEKGEEAIVPLDPFWKKLDSMTGGNTFNITMNVDGAKDPAQWAREFSRTLEVEMRTI